MHSTLRYPSVFKAYQFFTQGNYDACIHLCKGLLFTDSQDVDVLILLSTAHLHKDEFGPALFHAQQAHAIRPSAQTWATLGGVYIEIQNFEEALNAMEEAIKLEPRNLFHHHGKSAILVDLHRFHEAIKASNRVRTLLNQEYPHQGYPIHLQIKFKKMLLEHHRGLGIAFLMTSQFSASLKHINHALAIKADDIRSLSTKGMWLLHNRKYNAAIACFEQCAEHPEREKFGVLGAILIGSGFAYLYDNNPQMAVPLLEKALQYLPTDFIAMVGLYDAYKANQQFDKADALVKQGHIAPFLSKPLLSQQSYVIVYIWNPKHNDEYGHASLKIVHEGQTFYFSWFPPPEHSDDPWTMPSGYRKTSKVTSTQEANQRLLSFFNHQLPPNAALQIKGMLARQSDKEELRKSATFKIFFTAGINIPRLINWWQHLLSSNRTYGLHSYNCCDVIVHSLQYALDTNIPEISTVHTHRMKENKKRTDEDPLEAHYYTIPNRSGAKSRHKLFGTKSTAVYRYSYLLGQHINQHLKRTAVVIRFNRWNKALRTLTKFDYDPLRFDPNWLTKTKKIHQADSYSMLINQCMSKIFFIHAEEGEESDESEAQQKQEEEKDNQKHLCAPPIESFQCATCKKICCMKCRKPTCREAPCDE